VATARQREQTMLHVEISKTFGSFSLDLRFTHESGIMMLFGPSGSGKTTTLRCIAGLDRPTSGTVRVGDECLYSSERRISTRVQRRSIGFVFQQPRLFPHMTALGNIEYAARDKRDIDRYLSLFRVEHTADRLPKSLSGGEQQRIAIIRALVTKPKVLLLDEPMSAVDVATRAVLLDELRDLHRSTGLLMLYVTHSLSEVYRLGDRVLVLDNGRVIHDGVPIDVLHAPTSVPLASLSGTENILNGIVASHQPDDHTTDLRVGDVLLHVPLCDARVGASASVAVRPEDILIARHELQETSARNQFRGRIERIEQDTLPLLRIKIGRGATIRARVTMRSIKSLELAEGADVFVLIKAWSFHPIEPESVRIQRRD
jgi:molybdate transport system ATP-binding protein